MEKEFILSQLYKGFLSVLLVICLYFINKLYVSSLTYLMLDFLLFVKTLNLSIKYFKAPFVTGLGK